MGFKDLLRIGVKVDAPESLVLMDKADVVCGSSIVGVVRSKSDLIFGVIIDTIFFESIFMSSFSKKVVPPFPNLLVLCILLS